MKTYITSFALTRSSLSGDYMRPCQCISLKKKKQIVSQCVDLMLRINPI